MAGRPCERERRSDEWVKSQPQINYDAICEDLRRPRLEKEVAANSGDRCNQLR
jgi:hypothetical protein